MTRRTTLLEDEGRMLPAAVTSAQAVRRYNFLRPLYALNAALGSGTSREAVELAAVRDGHVVVELAVGTGRDAVRLARRVGPTGLVAGMDLAAGMLRGARDAARRAEAGRRVRLARADARRLPIAGASVDVVFGSRLLDLLETPEIGLVLRECRRVLKPGGRLVLVHMSKPSAGSVWFERLWRYVPGFRGFVFIVRPVMAAPLLQAAGFDGVSRVYRRTFPVGSEIVSGSRPASDV